MSDKYLSLQSQSVGPVAERAFWSSFWRPDAFSFLTKEAKGTGQSSPSLSQGAGKPWLSLPCVLPAAAGFSLATGFFPLLSRWLFPNFHFAECSFWPCFSRAGSCSSANVCSSSKILSFAAVLITQVFRPKQTSSLSLNK